MTLCRHLKVPVMFELGALHFYFASQNEVTGLTWTLFHDNIF